MKHRNRPTRTPRKTVRPDELRYTLTGIDGSTWHVAIEPATLVRVNTHVLRGWEGRLPHVAQD